MTATSAQFAGNYEYRPVTINGQLLGRWAVAFTAFCGAFVMKEPSPYELMMVASIGGFLLAGMPLGTHAVSLATLFFLFNLGGVLSMFTMDDITGAPMYIAVSFFLGLSSVFWCAVIQTDIVRLRWLMRGYVWGATITAMLGILGYFNAFPGAEVFTRYDRAMGVFKDPNVFAPFLVMPFVYLVYGIMNRGWQLSVLRVIALMIIAGGLFLAFSRAAWGLTILATALVYGFSLATEKDRLQRQKLILLGVAGVMLIVTALAIALQFEAVSTMFEQRARVVQEYDGSQVGRFARHWIGFEWAATRPLGMGPLVFGKVLGEDTHNIWLKSLMAYSWLGFLSYMTIVVITLVGGGRLLGRKRPWQPILFCAYATFVGHMLVAWVIDIDKWRHVYMVIGLIWGCMALERRYQSGATSLKISPSAQ